MSKKKNIAFAEDEFKISSFTYVSGKKKFSAFSEGEFTTSSFTTCWGRRPEVNLKNELRKLRKGCQEGTQCEAGSQRLDGLEAARGTLLDSHETYVIKAGSELNEGRHSQYMDKIEDNIDELKNIALLVVGDRDAQGTPGVRVNENKLMEDYELASIRMDAKIVDVGY